MKSTRAIITLLAVVVGASISSCKREEAPSPPVVKKAPATVSVGWMLGEARVIEGYSTPESIFVDREASTLYITNIETATDGHWVDDGKGFIARADLDGNITEERWVNSAPDAVINAPKGMCRLGGYLYFSDNARLQRVPITGGAPEVVSLPQGERLNDMASDGEAAYVSDIALSLIHRVTLAGDHQYIKSPPGPNGLTCRNGRLYGVSWTEHEIYELDSTGEAEPRAFGLAEHFTNLDSIEMLDDGSFIVSDFTAGKVFLVAPDRKAVSVLAEGLTSPADIGLDREASVLYVPQLKANKVSVYKLIKVN